MYVDAWYVVYNNLGAIINYNVLTKYSFVYLSRNFCTFHVMASKIYPKHLIPMFKRKKSHKQNIHNPKPKKYKHEITCEESFKAK